MIRRYLQVNDVHLSDQPPLMRTSSYRDDVLEKLAACMQIAQEHSVDGVVLTGDIFHRKAANHTSHQTVQDVRSVLDAGIPVWIVPGNHDVARGSGNLGGQPFISLLGDNIRLLYGTSSDQYIAGVAWDNAMEGEDGAAWIAAYIASFSTARPLVFAHAPLTPTPNPFGPEARGWLLTDDLTAALRDRDCAPLLIAHGHMHNRVEPHGTPTHLGALAPVYSNPGALSRGTIADTEQEPMVALITYDDGVTWIGNRTIDGQNITEEPTAPQPAVEVEYLPVPHRPASEVFRLREHAARSERDEGIANLAAGLATAETFAVTPESLVEQLEALDAPEGVADATWGEGIGYAAAAVEDANA